ncbi:MAG: glycosyltransferase [Armatimonadetes bacterium]|nr:glycosyltransferase [Armatimonadota bacterium]
MDSGQVFEDPRGWRRKALRTALFVFAGFVSTTFTLFLISMGILVVRNPSDLGGRIRQHLDPKAKGAVDKTARQLKREIETHPRLGRATWTSGDPLIIGYYAPWEPAGLASLKACASHLTHLAPVWLTLSKDGTLDTSELDPERNTKNREVLMVCKRNRVKVLPVLTNVNETGFDAKRLGALLKDPVLGQRLIDSTVRVCRSNHFAGINLDFELVEDGEVSAYVSWSTRLAESLKSNGLTAVADIPADATPQLIAGLAKSFDYLVVMAYDDHAESSAAGPVAPINWVDRQLDHVLKYSPESKVVLGLANYGYDWPRSGGEGQSVTFEQIMMASQKSKSAVDFDPDSMNMRLTYQDDTGKNHVIWAVDAPSAYNEILIGRERRLAGFSVWALGMEDPGLWNVLDSRSQRSLKSLKDLEEIRFPFGVVYQGKGEILDVISRPTIGERRISTDPESGFIDTVDYLRPGSSYLIQKSGYQPGKIVLTFDDGPDPQYTPKILDILREKHATGTFFCIGENVESNPSIVQDLATAGMEIGNHSYTHPNLGTVTPQRAALEITATTRVIEAITGRSTRLFRPPYNADSQPETVEEVRPVDDAGALGYISVGENVDPHDWDPTIMDSRGVLRPRTPQDLVKFVLDDLERRKGTDNEGNIVLLHDAGGDRTNTVKALPILIDKLRSAGYKIVPLSDLMQTSPAALMPSIPPSRQQALVLDRIVFSCVHWIQVLLTYGFILAIAIGIVRSLVTIGLALIRYFRHRSPQLVHSPQVDVVIAAYNEETTIVATISSVLASTYPVRQVVVVNDGSTDGTSAAVLQTFGTDARVKLVEKTNGGKASALRVGLEHSDSELLAFIDADTHLEASALEHLVSHFGDPKVGAVAGNVLVGNVVNMVTALQAVEYRTSQNVERRAYELLNMITVVPGAIGLWRREAIDTAGAWQADTLAEDMDLTWRVRMAGYRIVTESRAVAITEAPESWRALFKQRFRWSLGTLQCLYKNKRAIGRYGWFGRCALPSILIFQILFQLLGPLVDLQLLLVMLGFVFSRLQVGSGEISSVGNYESLRLALELYALFFSIEFFSGMLAYWMDRAKPTQLLWLFAQRFAYRQLMYLVMLKSLWRALAGSRTGWGKLHRTGNAISNTP